MNQQDARLVLSEYREIVSRWESTGQGDRGYCLGLRKAIGDLEALVEGHTPYTVQLAKEAEEIVPDEVVEYTGPFFCSDVEELLGVLEMLLNEGTFNDETGLLDSMGFRAYTTAMQTLAKYERLEIVEQYEHRALARWAYKVPTA